MLDSNFVLQYRGRIDNMYSDRLKKHAEVTEHNLRQTLAELVTGRPVSMNSFFSGYDAGSELKSGRFVESAGSNPLIDRISTTVERPR